MRRWPHRAEHAAQRASARGAPARAAALAQAAAGTHPRPRQPARLAAPYFLAGAAGSGGRVRASPAAEREMGAACPPVAARAAHRSARGCGESDLETACRFLRPRRSPTWPGGTRPAPRMPVAGCASYLGILVGRLDEASLGRLPQRYRAGTRSREPGCLAANPGRGGAPRSRERVTPSAGDQLREAARLPGFTGTPFPYEAPETVLALWLLWRGELDPARDLLQAVLDVAEQAWAHEEHAEAIKSSSRGGGVARRQLGFCGRLRPQVPTGTGKPAYGQDETRPILSRSSRRAAAISSGPASWPPLAWSRPKPNG